MVFGFKMQDFRSKSQLVAGGNITETPLTITYSIIVSRETMSIVLMIYSLNELGIKVLDMKNSYVTELGKGNL